MTFDLASPMPTPLVLAALHAVYAAVAPLPAAEPVVAIDAVEVRLRAGDDSTVEEQVRRVLPRAVRAAGRWGVLPTRITVTVHPTHESLAAATGRVHAPWMRAWARPGAVDLQSPRTWSRGFATDEGLFRLLAHELTPRVSCHAVACGPRASGMPMWFEEGLASLSAGEHRHGTHADALSDPARVLRSDPGAFYGTAILALQDLVDRSGETAVRSVLAAMGEGHAFPAAFRDATGVTLADFEGDVRRRISALAVRERREPR